jgi:hypothetical protein
MTKALFGLAAAAALAFALPNAALARDHGGGHGGGGGAHFSGGGGPSSGARSFSAARSASPGFSANRSVTGRSFNRSANVYRGNRGNRGVNARNFASANSRSVNRNNRMAWNGRHHRHHRGGGVFFWGPGYGDYYDDYAAYNDCYQYVWTRYGYRYVDTCSSLYYGVY